MFFTANGYDSFCEEAVAVVVGAAVFHLRPMILESCRLRADL